MRWSEQPDRSQLTELLTLPEAHRCYGIGLKTLRREAARGSFPVYAAGTHWPRVRRSEFDAWLRSTRVRVSDHARARVQEVLAREERIET